MSARIAAIPPHSAQRTSACTHRPNVLPPVVGSAATDQHDARHVTHAGALRRHHNRALERDVPARPVGSEHARRRFSTRIRRHEDHGHAGAQGGGAALAAVPAMCRDAANSTHAGPLAYETFTMTNEPACACPRTSKPAAKAAQTSRTQVVSRMVPRALRQRSRCGRTVANWNASDRAKFRSPG